MNPSSSPSLTYFPAYVGLFVSLLLAATCNAFLDIRYGSFGFEVLLWALVFGLTLRVGWRQQGRLGDGGRQGQKMVLILTLILTLVLFLPLWGLPRAGIAMLGMLQAAQNCVTVTRRQLHMGLLVSAVMVMFAATHFRADWTLLFYLVPYVAAVVFTLVAEQISRRAQDLRQQSLGPAVAGGQGAAIAAATAAILLLGALLYAITPQPTWPYLKWRYGQLSSLVLLGKDPQIDMGDRPGTQGEGAGGGGEGIGGEGQNGMGFDSRWPSPAEMREAARREGMPQWQRGTILKMADAGEWMSMTLKPLMQDLDELWKSFKEWLAEHSRQIAMGMALLAILAVLYALWRLLREIKAGVWLLTRLEYLRYGVLGRHGQGRSGARRLYGAMARLFELQDARRPDLANSLEYLALLRTKQGHLYREAAELTRLFEDARYGAHGADHAHMARMRALYRRIYQYL